MLVTTIEEVRAVVGIAIRKEGTFEVLKPYLDSVEETLIRDLIGDAQLDALKGTFSETEFDNSFGYLNTLQTLTKTAIIWNGYLDAWFHTLYQMGNTGVGRQRPKDTEGLFRYQEEGIQKDILRKADAAVERLMEYLVSHSASFPLWKASPEYQANQAFIISTSESLYQALPEVTKSYRMYMVLRGYMYRVERTTARLVMGDQLYFTLIDKLTSGDVLDANYKILLRYASEYVAPATLLEAMPFIRVQFTPTGVRVLNVMNNLQDETAIVTDEAKWLMGILSDRVLKARGQLRVFLNASSSSAVFPEYFNSDLYQAPGLKEWTIPQNEGKKHFRM